MPRTVRLTWLLCLLCALGLAYLPLRSHAEPPPSAAHTTKTKTPAGPSCKLDDVEAPRGGRIVVSGERFGQAPVVRIAGKVARILERHPDKISVQVARDSDGGLVTVQAGGKSAECGSLTIIGKDR